MSAAPHIPVLLNEVVRGVALAAGQTIIDATFGAGGYTRAFLAAGAKVIAFDRDERAIDAGRALEAAAGGKLTLIHARFSDMAAELGKRGIAAADAVAFDLGVSSMQLDQAERGFSFRFDGPLDMRMGGQGRAAADLVASLSEGAIAGILYRYGEERRSRAIAKAIVARRAERPIERTSDLADLIEKVLGRGPRDQIHPATRSFQALRIAVNRELEEVGDGLAAAETLLRPGGRLAVVTFHSLEDRIAKLFLAERAKESQGSRHLPAASGPAPSFALLSRKAITPGDAETAVNPRARSAKLRLAERLAAPARPADDATLGIVRLDDLVRRGGRP